ncbi:MAG TPA: c-type cytochrome [Flavitalea sp.]|nr:c-type cytochrome [Flavitalea sp.]
MKKAFILLFSTAVIYSCNSGGDTKKEETKAPDTATAPAPPPADAGLPNEKGLELIGASDCTTCHAIDRKIIGPAYNDVAKKYANADASIVDTLAHKVKVGGVGVWGNIPMTPHPTLPDNDIKEMIKYILTLKNQ